MAEAFPPGLMRPEMLRAVLNWIRMLPLDNRIKKATLYEWCMTVGVDLEGWMVEYVTGLPAGEV